MNNMIITEHAYKRAKERLKWKNSVLDKMAEIALKEGLRHKDTKGTLRKYIDKLWLKYKNCNNIRIYGENIYIFPGSTLVTIYRLDNKLIKYIKY